MSGRPGFSEAEVTAELCALIGETLEIKDVTADEDFFELGGTSLNGAVLIARIENRFTCRLRLADLYEAPTAAGLGTRLRRETPSASDLFSVATLPSPHAGSTTAPVFLVHLIPPDLVRALGGRRPVIGLSYGLGAAGDDTGWPPPVGIAGLAAHYVEQIRLARPDGPYHLAGHSTGGLIAWEMAHQLAAEGAEVGVLCLIDTRTRWRRVGWRSILRNIASTSPRVLWLLAQRSVLWRLVRVADRMSHMLLPTVSEEPQDLWERSDQAHRLDLLELQRDAYRMTPLGGRLLLIEASRLAGIRSEPIPLASSYDSAGLAPDGYTLVQLPGNHLSLVVSPLAEQVAAAIDDAIRAYEMQAAPAVAVTDDCPRVPTL